MISSAISKLIILLFGTLYPAYASYKAVKTRNVKEYVKWMMYWIVFALFTSAETFTDIFLSFWFPFYYELKIILVVYLLSPATNGSSILYRKFVHPMLSKKEQEIDGYIAKAMEQGYHTMLSIGSRGIAYTTSIIMQTAIRGGGGLVNHIRKSYSLDDMNTHEARNRRITDGSDETDEVEERAIMRQKRRNHSPMRMSAGSQFDMQFSDIDGSMPIRSRPRPVRSSEDFSSGYSSPDPVYAAYDSRYPLNRTTSMGPTTRARTRVASEKLRKKYVVGLCLKYKFIRKCPWHVWIIIIIILCTVVVALSLPIGELSFPIMQDESGCSTTEQEASQYETDDGFPMSFPPFHPSLARFVKPEYRYLFAGVPIMEAGGLSAMGSTVEVPKAAPSTVLRTIIAEKKEVEEPGAKIVKHKKRQAPVPPEKGAEDYRTPDASPIPVRKLIIPDLEMLEDDGEEVEESKAEENEKKEKTEEVPKEASGKVEEVPREATERDVKKKAAKSGKESQITKMLHLSKIHIPFWSQKSWKHSPLQESGDLPRNGSHASLASQDSYISLKGEETAEEDRKSELERQMSVREMSHSPSSKRRSVAAE